MPTYWVNMNPSLETLAITIWWLGPAINVPNYYFSGFQFVFGCVTYKTCLFKYFLILEHANILGQPKPWNFSFFHMVARMQLFFFAVCFWMPNLQNMCFSIFWYWSMPIKWVIINSSWAYWGHCNHLIKLVRIELYKFHLNP